MKTLYTATKLNSGSGWIEYEAAVTQFNRHRFSIFLW
jgi:hypothetical protein